MAVARSACLDRVTAAPRPTVSKASAIPPQVWKARVAPEEPAERVLVPERAELVPERAELVPDTDAARIVS